MHTNLYIYNTDTKGSDPSVRGLKESTLGLYGLFFLWDPKNCLIERVPY